MHTKNSYLFRHLSYVCSHVPLSHLRSKKSQCLCNGYTMDTHALPDIYTLAQASVYIRQSTSAHGITNISTLRSRSKIFYCHTLLLYKKPVIVGLNFALKITVIVGYY